MTPARAAQQNGLCLRASSSSSKIFQAALALIFVLGVVACARAQQDAASCTAVDIDNFDAGSLANWDKTNTMASELCSDSITPGGCSSNYVPFGPYAGPYSAFNSFDGSGGVSKFCTKATYNLSANTFLNFAWIARWDMIPYGATKPRTFDVEVMDANGGVAQSTQIVIAQPGTNNALAPWMQASVPMPAINNAKLCFVWTVPESYTGPAAAGVDNVALSCGAAASASSPTAQSEMDGLAGSPCYDDSDCMSRMCVGEVCAATTCGLAPTKGGVGATMPSGYCSTYGIYSPDRVCVFGFGQCTKAECCPTLPCGAGVADVYKPILCGNAGLSFDDSRLCTGESCTASDCCVQTRCDGPGGIPVASRSTLCPEGEAFFNAGICSGGAGNCTPDECCVFDARMCSVAFDGSCPAGSTLIGSRLYDSLAEDAYGGCCETTTCATGVPESAKSGFCSSTPSTEFSATSPCGGSQTEGCTVSECCTSTAAFCSGDATWSAALSSCTCPEGKEYLIGVGCVCPAGTGAIGAQGACDFCPHGQYSSGPTRGACSSCPVQQPYTAAIGSTSDESCIDYCAQEELKGNPALCSPGGTCKSLSGDSSSGGSFECTCLAGWMGYADPSKEGKTIKNNCDAPTTLLRLRALSATNVNLPPGLELRVSDTAKGETPEYARQAPAPLDCKVPGAPRTAALPSCTSGALSAVDATSTTATRLFVGTKVRLSTNYDDVKLANAPLLAIEWACSDGGGEALSSGTFDVVLPGPSNPINVQTLVCTAIVRQAADNTTTAPPIKVKLAAGSEIPEPAAGSGGTAGSSPVQLTISQPGGILCSLPVSAVSADSDGPYVPFECSASNLLKSGISGTIGVVNVDMDRYKLVWTCGSNVLTTSYAGEATTPLLPTADQSSLLCEAKFEPKTQLELKVVNTAALSKAVKVTVTQSGMKANEPCTATIPASATPAALAQTVELTCPGKSLGPGMTTSLATDADLTKHLIEFACTSAATTGQLFRRKNITVESTQEGSSDITSCTLTISALPPLLRLSFATSGVGLPASSLRVMASQDGANVCSLPWFNPGDSSATSSVECPIGPGLLPGREATLWPDSTLDAGTYLIDWNCENTKSFSTSAIGYSGSVTANWAKVLLNANPNDGGETVECTGMVSASPIQVRVATTLDELKNNQFQLRVRQAHQSAPCTAQASPGAADALVGKPPVCEGKGLKASTRTTLSMDNPNSALYKVTWLCSGGDVVVAAAGVATVTTPTTGGPLVCTATIEKRPPLLTVTAVGTGPSNGAAPWSLTARQSTQSRACSVAGTAASTPTAPICSVSTQPLLQGRATILATVGLDASLWEVTWSCKASDGTTELTLAETKSSSGAVVANSVTIPKLERDAELGGGTIACTATLMPRADVLRLKATGDGVAAAPSSMLLTAKQPKQTAACSLPVVSANINIGVAPTCPSNGPAIETGASLQLGVTSRPALVKVTWACKATPASGGAEYNLDVTQGNDGQATVKSLPTEAATTVCTATVSLPVQSVLKIFSSVSGLGFTAKQGGESSVCPALPVSDVSTQVECSDAAPKTSTTLQASSGGTQVRFLCDLTTSTGGGQARSWPVRAVNSTAATIITPPAGDSITCRLANLPVLTLSSNVAAVLKAEAVDVTTGVATATCASAIASTRLFCDGGTGQGQLPLGAQRIKLSQTGLSNPGSYRWACSASSAKIERFDSTGPGAYAYIILPQTGSLSCTLTYSSGAQQSVLGRLRRMF